MSALGVRTCLTALATAALCGTTALGANSAVAAVASKAAPDISKVPCSSSTVTVIYDSTKKACYSGTGEISVAITKVDQVETGVNTGHFTAQYNGSESIDHFVSGEDILLSPENVWEITSIDITAN